VTRYARMSGLLMAALAAAPAAAAERPLALVGGEVHPVGGPPIPGGTVVVRGERIVAVGRDVDVPPDAERIDCRGKRVTPGLVDADGSVGLVEIELEASTVDDAVASPDPVRAAIQAADAIDLASTLVGVSRRHGVTSVVSVPRGGLVSGQSAWVQLLDPTSPLAAQAVRGPAAMHLVLGEEGAAAAGRSRASALLAVREHLEDVRVFARSRAAFERGGLDELSASRLDLAALAPVVDGRLRVVVSVSRAADIRAVLALARAERLRVALLGAEEAWLVAGELAKAEVPVILDPLANLPARFEARHARSDAAALLAAAGVEVVLATRRSHNASGLRFALGNAVRAGLSTEQALRAATLAPARVFGVDADLGTLAPGKLADVVVWSGDPFEPSSHAEVVLVRGERQAVDSRQTRLARRHMERLGLPRR
jgi:imidazolonepropionase-like amidohydrolase